MHVLLVLICAVIPLLLSENQTNKITEKNQRPIKIIAHRGVHKSLPENTLPAFQAAVDLRLDYVEIDVRTTADGYMVLRHDNAFDRKSGSRQMVSDLTLQQIHKVDEKIPLFGEALAYMSGKIGVYVDVKRAAPKAVIAELEKHNMLDYAVIYAGESALAEMIRINPAVKIMPEVDSEEDLARVKASLKPQIVAMSWEGFSEALVAKIHQAGAKVFLDILGNGDNPDGVRRTIAAGVDGIQTDDPDIVLATISRLEK